MIAGRDIERLLEDAANSGKRGDYAGAARVFEQILTHDRSHLLTLMRYGLLALQVGDMQRALFLAQRAVTVHPGSAEAHHCLALAQYRTGKHRDAMRSMSRALALRPRYMEATLNLGNMMLETGDPQAALERYQAALDIAPGSAVACNNSGNAYRELGRLDDALQAYRRALVLDPDNVEAHNNIGNMLKDRGDAAAAISAFQRALELAPNRPDIWSNLLLAMNGWDRASAVEIAAEHRRFGEHFAGLLAAVSAPSMPSPRSASGADRRLHIGYVSSDFRRHAVAAFLLPLLRSHDRQRFRISCYDNGLQPDDVTELMRAQVDEFRTVVGVSDRALADLVGADGVDVLVDLNGHTARNRLPLFFLRPAAVQVTWLGYLCTTGIEAIDYRLTDGYADPPGTTEALYTETLWRLPETLWCYTAHSVAPPLQAPPHYTTGHVTFACLNNPAKVSPLALSTWAAILAAVPDSRLLLMTGSHADRMNEVSAFFEARGIARDRVEQNARLSLPAYLQMYQRADIALDSFPYSGGTTTCDALWMGLPVVTLAGDRAFARSGVSVLGNVGVPQWIASSPADYVRIATNLATDSKGLAPWRQNLRSRMQHSPLMDETRFARDIEAAFTAMVAGRA